MPALINMKLEEFVLALFEEQKNPEEIPGLKKVEQLDEIHDLVVLYFIDRKVEAISALMIEEYFPINEEIAGIIKGEWELGGYNDEKKCYYPMGKYTISRLPPNQAFMTQKRLDSDEVYMKDFLVNV